MVDIENYIARLTGLLKERFGERLAYIGLQGSYLRGEATDASDIDIMAVIDGFCVEDMDAYRDAIASLEHFELSCGFICGKDDLARWNPLEICSLVHGTRDHYGVLSELVPQYTREDVRNFLKMSVNNLYHEICHRYIHADAEANKTGLRGSFKGAFFILQGLHYWRSGVFAAAKAELLPKLSGKDRLVLENCMQLRADMDYDFKKAFALLFAWCRETLAGLDEG